MLTLSRRSGTVGITTGDRGNEQTTKSGYNDMMIRKGVERTPARTFLFLIVCCVLQIGLLLVWAVEGTAQGDSEADRGEVSMTSADKVAAFLDPHKNKIFLPTYVTNRLSEAELPALYDALDNEVFARQWNRALFAICVLEEDEKVFETVKKFVSTPWDRSKSKISGHEATRVIRGITSSVVNLAMVEPTLSAPFLQEIFTREGAERFLEGWKGYAFPESDIKRIFVDDLMFGAAGGLLHLRDPAYFSVVEDKFYEIYAIPVMERSEAQGELFFTCRRLLASRLVYEEMGWDEGITYLHTLDSEAAIATMTNYMAEVLIQAEESRRGGE